MVKAILVIVVQLLVMTKWAGLYMMNQYSRLEFNNMERPSCRVNHIFLAFASKTFSKEKRQKKPLHSDNPTSFPDGP